MLRHFEGKCTFYKLAHLTNLIHMSFLNTLFPNSKLKDIKTSIHKIEKLLEKPDNSKLNSIKNAIDELYILIFKDSASNLKEILNSEASVSIGLKPSTTIAEYLNHLEDLAFILRENNSIVISPIFKNDDLKVPRSHNDQRFRDRLLELNAPNVAIHILVKRINPISSTISTVEFIFEEMRIIAPIINSFLDVPSDFRNKYGVLKFFPDSLYGQDLMISGLSIH